MARAEMIAVVLAVGACGAPPPPKPPATPPLEGDDAPAPGPAAAIDAGKACVHATAQCDVAVCAAEIHNECEAAVRCEMAVVAECRPGSAGGVLEAHGLGRDALDVDTAANLEAAADCGDAAVVATRVERLSCK